MAGPSVGVALGSLGIGAGAALVTRGSNNWFGEDNIFDERTRDGADIAAITMGSVLLAGGLASVIYSSIRIRRKRQDRSVECVGQGGRD